MRWKVRLAEVVGAGLLALALADGASAAPTPCRLVAKGFRRGAATSADCYPCHDGSVDRGMALHMIHPIDVSYAAAWREGRRDLGGRLPPALVLPGGQVTCTTCHDGRSREPYRLALPADGLCQACHRR